MIYKSLLLVFALIFFSGCCEKKVEKTSWQAPPSSVIGTKTTTEQAIKTDSALVSNKDLGAVKNTGFVFSIDGGEANYAPSAGSFEEKYRNGVQLLQTEDYSRALNLFIEILDNPPGPEEASIAELCIAEIHFRNKANRLALQSYQRILDLYPDTHAAENARAGIEYLNNIERYQDEYVSPCVEGKQRRGY